MPSVSSASPTNSNVTESRFPDLGRALPRRGSRVTRGLARFVFRRWGWTCEGPVPDVPRLVLIGAPHTSNWDFVLGMVAMFALGIRVDWVGKHTIFRPPLGRLMRWLGGIPVDRRATRGVVPQLADAFARRDRLVLGLAPEGTRKKVDAWKTGFYRIAERARVPILPVALDWGTKTIRFFPPLVPSGDMEEDLAAIRRHFDASMALRPAQF